MTKIEIGTEKGDIAIEIIAAIETGIEIKIGREREIR